MQARAAGPDPLIKFMIGLLHDLLVSRRGKCRAIDLAGWDRTDCQYAKEKAGRGAKQIGGRNEAATGHGVRKDVRGSIYEEISSVAGYDSVGRAYGQRGRGGPHGRVGQG